jgi:predicted transcriptional regulator
MERKVTMNKKQAKRQTKKKSNTRGTGSLDIHFGEKLRAKRLMMDMTQVGLANAIGVSFQQVQKYERAANRISAAQLLIVARVLKVDISYFFDGAPST